MGIKLSSIDDQFLQKVYENIDENLENERFSVEDLAKNTGLSRSMLHRKLKMLTGKSASDLIMETRMNRAMELLENDVATASEIAYKVGFNSPSYFFKVFKKHFGIPPGDIKKKFKSKELNSNINRKRNIDLQKKKTWVFLVITTFLIVLAVELFIYYTKDKNPVRVEKSIAVLPFDNFGTEQENRFFADGMVDDLLNRLSRIDNLKVISRTSSEKYREKGKNSIPQIAHELGVIYIIEGSVQRDKNRIRVNIQLIDAIDDNHIWSKLYECDLTDVFKIQSETAIHVAQELDALLNNKDASKLNKDNTINHRAMEFYQMGKYFLETRNMEDCILSIDYFKKAIREDSTYALAYAGLANAFYINAWFGWINLNIGRDSAEIMARKALELDDELAEAYAVLGAIYQELEIDVHKAEQYYIKAIKFNPSYSFVYHYYSELLYITERKEKAREMINKGISIDPLSFSIRNVSSLYYLYEKEYTKSLEENILCLKLIPNKEWILYRNFIIYAEIKDETNALRSIKKLGQVNGQFSMEQADSAYTSQGINGLLKLIINTTNDWYQKAECYVVLNDKDKAIEALENAYKLNFLHPFNLLFFISRDFNSIRRFRQLKEELE